MILLVGANGFLGSKISEELIKKRKRFIRIDKSLKGKEKLDINDLEKLNKFFRCCIVSRIYYISYSS